MANRENCVVIEGNLTRDPELKFNANNLAWCRLGIAYDKPKRKHDGTFETEPQFVDVTLFGAMAENTGASLGKGDRVIVQGTLDWRQWEAEDGSKRSAHSIVVDAIGASLRFREVTVGPKKGGNGGGSWEPEFPNQPPPQPASAQAVVAGQAFDPDEEPF